MKPNAGNENLGGGISEKEFEKLREEYDKEMDEYMKEWETSLREAMERE